MGGGSPAGSRDRTDHDAGEPVAGVAAAIGYESEAAFSRAFKKLVGDAPATWRRAHAAGFTSGQ